MDSFRRLSFPSLILFAHRVRPQDARKELEAAVEELQEKARVVDALHDKLLGVNNTLAFFDSELQVRSLDTFEERFW